MSTSSTAFQFELGRPGLTYFVKGEDEPTPPLDVDRLDNEARIVAMKTGEESADNAGFEPPTFTGDGTITDGTRRLIQPPPLKKRSSSLGWRPLVASRWPTLLAVHHQR